MTLRQPFSTLILLLGLVRLAPSLAFGIGSGGAIPGISGIGKRVSPGILSAFFAARSQDDIASVIRAARHEGYTVSVVSVR